MNDNTINENVAEAARTVLKNYYARHGNVWHSVSLLQFSREQLEWCAEHCKHNYHQIGRYWLFEAEQDAAAFILRWK